VTTSTSDSAGRAGGKFTKSGEVLNNKQQSDRAVAASEERGGGQKAVRNPNVTNCYPPLTLLSMCTELIYTYFQTLCAMWF
jgi:hypothetical protein